MQGNYFTVLHYFVFQVDGPYAAVKFPPKDSALHATAAALSNEEAGGSLLQDVRLLRKDELQVAAVVNRLFSSCHFIYLTKFCSKNILLLD